MGVVLRDGIHGLPRSHSLNAKPWADRLPSSRSECADKVLDHMHMFELSPTSYAKVIPLLNGIEFNCLFARSVLDGLANGEVWADSEIEPTLVHIIHSYGMTLLLVRSENPDLDTLRNHFKFCRDRWEALWMQVHPTKCTIFVDECLDIGHAPSRSSVSSALLVERHTRSNFTFVRERYAELCSQYKVPSGFRVRPMSAADFALSGISVSPHRFWPDASGFLANGGGYCVIGGEQVASLAFTSFRIHEQLEIGIETYPEFRGMGLAKLAAAALIEYCLSEGLEPVWSCRKQNFASFALATSLGFLPSVEGPYYGLPGTRERSDVT